MALCKCYYFMSTPCLFSHRLRNPLPVTPLLWTRLKTGPSVNSVLVYLSTSVTVRVLQGPLRLSSQIVLLIQCSSLLSVLTWYPSWYIPFRKSITLWTWNAMSITLSLRYNLLHTTSSLIVRSIWVKTSLNVLVLGFFSLFTPRLKISGQPYTFIDLATLIFS